MRDWSNGARLCRTRGFCGLLLGCAGMMSLKPLLFVMPSFNGAPAQHSTAEAPHVDGTKGHSFASDALPNSYGKYVASLAGAIVCLAASSTNSIWSFTRGRKPRRLNVAMKALGSIEQFKVFGPPEDPFEIETDKVIGVGGQGTVYICHRRSNPSVKYAVKTIPIWRLLMDPSSAEKIKEIRKETDVLVRIQGHPNVCECIGCYDAFRPGTSEAQYIMIVMEKIEGGELASYIKDGQSYLAEDVAKSVTKQIVEGLKFIHSRHVVHRDLKAENVLVCGAELTAQTPVKLIDFGVAKNTMGTVARSCVGTTEIMAPELVSAKLMLLPKGKVMNTHGPYTFKSPQQMSPGFGIISQRPDGKGAMVNGIEPGGQAEQQGVGDGWAIMSINGTNILEMPFVKDFNEIGAGTKSGVTAIAEILGSLDGDFTLEFVELPKREFSTMVDLWSLGVTLYTMLAGVTPFNEEEQIVNGEYEDGPIAHCSPDAKDLLKGLLQVDPDQRLTLDQVLAHKWLGGVSSTAQMSAAAQAMTTPPAPISVPPPVAPPAAAAAPPTVPTVPTPTPAPSTPAAAPIAVGTRVMWNGKCEGTVKFVGQTRIAAGEFVGVELDQPQGMHDGTVMGEAYFSCKPQHGVLCPPSMVEAIVTTPPTTSTPMPIPPPAPAAAVPAAVPAVAGSGEIMMGSRVMYQGVPGIVRYIGHAHFATGEWVGVELEKPQGLHDGTQGGTRYFTCPDKCGVFCTRDRLQVAQMVGA